MNIMIGLNWIKWNKSISLIYQHRADDRLIVRYGRPHIYGRLTQGQGKKKKKAHENEIIILLRTHAFSR